MNSLGLQDALDGLARASWVGWYGSILRRVIDDVLRKALNFQVVERRMRGRPNMFEESEWKNVVIRSDCKRKWH